MLHRTPVATSLAIPIERRLNVPPVTRPHPKNVPSHPPKPLRGAHVIHSRSFAVFVASANDRLAAMSEGRYALAHVEDREGNKRSGLGLRIHDSHTEQPRDPGTLSGGETFYCSLALALGQLGAGNAAAALGTLGLTALYGSIAALLVIPFYFLAKRLLGTPGAVVAPGRAAEACGLGLASCRRGRPVAVAQPELLLVAGLALGALGLRFGQGRARLAHPRARAPHRRAVERAVGSAARGGGLLEFDRGHARLEHAAPGVCSAAGMVCRVQGLQALAGDVGVDRRGGDVGVTEQRLSRARVGGVGEEVGGGRVAGRGEDGA